MSGMRDERRVLGFAHGERVFERRTGLCGRVRLLELTEEDRAEDCAEAEVVWDGLFCTEQLELALERGLSRLSGPGGAW